MSRKDQLTDYVAVIDAEKAAWLVAKDHLPGMPFFRIDLWLRWREAARWRNAVGQSNGVLDRLYRRARPVSCQLNCGSQPTTP